MHRLLAEGSVADSCSKIPDLPPVSRSTIAEAPHPAKSQQQDHDDDVILNFISEALSEHACLSNLLAWDR
jgi:hypothetical protein